MHVYRKRKKKTFIYHFNFTTIKVERKEKKLGKQNFHGKINLKMIIDGMNYLINCE